MTDCKKNETTYRRRRARREYWKNRRKPSPRRRAMLLYLTPLVATARRAWEKCLRANNDPTGFGIDYAFLPHPSIAAMKKSGVKFVARYVTNNDPRRRDNTKTLGVDEARALKAAGLTVVLVWETGAARALEGAAAGARDATVAKKHADLLFPNGDGVLYFAVDFDAEPASVRAYFEGVATVLPRNEIGVYAGVRVVNDLVGRDLVSHAWQTLAWSGGAWEPAASLRQYAIERSLGGADVDFNRAVSSNYGGW